MLPSPLGRSGGQGGQMGVLGKVERRVPRTPFSGFDLLIHRMGLILSAYLLQSSHMKINKTVHV